MNKENSWRTPTTIIAVIGLLVSILGNIIQYNQNQIVNAKAIDENNRANLEAQKTAKLQAKKEEHLQSLNAELKEIDQEIYLIKNQIGVANIGISLTNQNLSGRAIDNFNNGKRSLEELESKRADLQKQINDFLALYR